MNMQHIVKIQVTNDNVPNWSFIPPTARNNKVKIAKNTPNLNGIPLLAIVVNFVFNINNTINNKIPYINVLSTISPLQSKF